MENTTIIISRLCVHNKFFFLFQRLNSSALQLNTSNYTNIRRSDDFSKHKKKNENQKQQTHLSILYLNFNLLHTFTPLLIMLEINADFNRTQN